MKTHQDKPYLTTSERLYYVFRRYRRKTYTSGTDAGQRWRLRLTCCAWKSLRRDATYVSGHATTCTFIAQPKVLERAWHPMVVVKLLQWLSSADKIVSDELDVTEA